MRPSDLLMKYHENPTTLDYTPEFACLSCSGRIFRMPKIENSFTKRVTMDKHQSFLFLCIKGSEANECAESEERPYSRA